MQELSRLTCLTAIRGKSEVTTSSLQGLSALPQLGCLFLDELKLVDDAGQPCTAPLSHSTALTKLGNVVIPAEVLSDCPNNALHACPKCRCQSCSALGQLCKIMYYGYAGADAACCYPCRHPTCGLCHFLDYHCGDWTCVQTGLKTKGHPLTSYSSCPGRCGS